VDLTTRIALRRLFEQQPGVTDADLPYFEYVVDAVDAGMTEAVRGELIPHAELKHRLRQRWPVTSEM
jgi:predicted transcriptional regulator